MNSLAQIIEQDNIINLILSISAKDALEDDEDTTSLIRNTDIEILDDNTINYSAISKPYLIDHDDDSKVDARVFTAMIRHNLNEFVSKDRNMKVMTAFKHFEVNFQEDLIDPSSIWWR